MNKFKQYLFIYIQKNGIYPVHSLIPKDTRIAKTYTYSNYEYKVNIIQKKALKAYTCLAAADLDVLTF